MAESENALVTFFQRANRAWLAQGRGISRREFLGVIVGGSAVLLTSCDAFGDPNPECTVADGADTCDGLPKLEVPQGYMQQLQTIVRPLVSLLSIQAQKELKIRIYQGVKDTRYPGQGIALVDQVSKIEHIDVFLTNTSDKELLFGRQTAYHEACHIFDKTVGNVASGTLQPLIDGELAQVEAANLTNGDLIYKLLTESTYTGYYMQGHPIESKEELFASALNVMQLAQDHTQINGQTLLERLHDANTPEDVRRVVATICITAVKALQQFSVDPADKGISLRDFLVNKKFPYQPDFMRSLYELAGINVVEFEQAA